MWHPGRGRSDVRTGASEKFRWPCFELTNNLNRLSNTVSIRMRCWYRSREDSPRRVFPREALPEKSFFSSICSYSQCSCSGTEETIQAGRAAAQGRGPAALPAATAARPGEESTLKVLGGTTASVSVLYRSWMMKHFHRHDRDLKVDLFSRPERQGIDSEDIADANTRHRGLEDAGPGVGRGQPGPYRTGPTGRGNRSGPRAPSAARCPGPPCPVSWRDGPAAARAAPARRASRPASAAGGHACRAGRSGTCGQRRVGAPDLGLPAGRPAMQSMKPSEPPRGALPQYEPIGNRPALRRERQGREGDKGRRHIRADHYSVV